MNLQIEIKNMTAGEVIQGIYLLKTLDVKQGANGKTYLDLTIGDKTGDINCKVWDYSEGMENTLQANGLIKIRGTVNEWQGRNQMKIDKIRAASEEDGAEINDFVAAAPEKPEDMLIEIVTYIDRIKDYDIRSIVSYIVEDCEEKLLYYPAAKKNHHSIRGGLLYHILSMLRAGEKLLQVYSWLNADLLYAGVILHDLAKTVEMESSELGIVSDYTIEGNMLGHIITGIKMIENTGRDLGSDAEKVMLLQHMVLSHHYEPEYGSPVRPKLPEAEMLHYLDIIDARMYDIKKALDGVQGGSFGEKIWSLENRAFYKPKMED